MRIHVNGKLAKGVSAKDIILHIIATIGVNGGTGHVIEYSGNVFREMDMEARMTVCNMSIECGARAGLIAPDEITFEYLENRIYAPKGTEWQESLADWQSLYSDGEANFDREVYISAEDIPQTVTYGTHPGMAIAISENIPQSNNPSEDEALEYMQLKVGESLTDKSIDRVFIGSCTNSRISDLRLAARELQGKQVVVPTLIVAGSEKVKQQAEREGLDKIFIASGAEWREPGCSMCIGMNGDIGQQGDLVVSTSNRNFVGRQGKGVRTILASPAVAAASAVKGKVSAANQVKDAA